jgi:hypothetical protein
MVLPYGVPYPKQLPYIVVRVENYIKILCQWKGQFILSSYLFALSYKLGSLKLYLDEHKIIGKLAEKTNWLDKINCYTYSRNLEYNIKIGRKILKKPINH